MFEWNAIRLRKYQYWTHVWFTQIMVAREKFFVTDCKFFVTDCKFFVTREQFFVYLGRKKFTVSQKKFTVGRKKFTVGNKKFTTCAANLLAPDDHGDSWFARASHECHERCSNSSFFVLNLFYFLSISSKGILLDRREKLFSSYNHCVQVTIPDYNRTLFDDGGKSWIQTSRKSSNRMNRHSSIIWTSHQNLL